MDDYINEVNKDYNICEKANNLISILYFIIVVISIILLFTSKQFLEIILIMIHIFYFIISTLNDIILFNYAEEERLKTSISNAYNIKLTSKQTKKFYNNDEIKYGLKKLGLNSFESVFHTNKNCKEMLKYKTFSATFYFIIWLSIILIFKEKNLILCITQTIFSSELMYSYFKFLYFNYKISKIYESFYNVYSNNKYSSKLDGIIIENYVEYESVKRYSHILLSNKIFTKNQEKWAIEWNELKSKLK